MKCTIRLNSFETNSSSTHGVCVANNDMYKKFLEGRLIISSEIPDDVLEEVGMDRFGDYDPDEIADRIRNDESFREKLDIDDYYISELSLSSRTTMEEIMFYHGLWTLKGLKDSHYIYRFNETKSPEGEDIVVLGYYGWS